MKTVYGSHYKKGQAAIEFLMTYGWAIMGLMVAIGALSYMGLLSPSEFMPEKCDIVVGFTCTDFKLSTNQLQLELINSMGDAVTITGIDIINPETLENVCAYSTSTPLANGAKTLASINCNDATKLAPAGTKMNLKIKVKYTKTIGTQTFPEHPVFGTLYARVS